MFTSPPVFTIRHGPRLQGTHLAAHAPCVFVPKARSVEASGCRRSPWMKGGDFSLSLPCSSVFMGNMLLLDEPVWYTLLMGEKLLGVSLEVNSSEMFGLPHFQTNLLDQVDSRPGRNRSMFIVPCLKQSHTCKCSYTGSSGPQDM